MEPGDPGKEHQLTSRAQALLSLQEVSEAPYAGEGMWQTHMPEL